MISVGLYDYAVRSWFRNKQLIHEFEKIYDSNDKSYEVRSFYLERKKVGLLFLRLDGHYYATKMTKSSTTADKSGRVKPVICDLCYTRMPGSKIAQVTFRREFDKHSNTWLLCSDLTCSMRAREMTAESVDSKKLLGENVSIDTKIERLEKHIANIVETLQLPPLKGQVYDK
jgi:hypothetical protein